MRIISNQDKMKVIKDFLSENGIEYKEYYKSKYFKVILPLYIPKHRICVRIGDSQRFYMTVRKKAAPIFIRDEDTEEKVLEKIQTTIIKQMKIQQKHSLKICLKKK